MAVLRAHRIALLLRRRLDPPGHGRRTNATLRRQAALVEEAKGALARGARTVGPSSTKAHSAYICKVATLVRRYRSAATWKAGLS